MNTIEKYDISISGQQLSFLTDKATILEEIIGGENPRHKISDLLANYSLDLFEVSPDIEIQRLTKMSIIQISRIRASLSLGKFRNIEKTEKPIIGSSKAIADYLMPLIGYDEQESLIVVPLDVKNRVLDVIHLYTGTKDVASVDISEVFKHAIRWSAKSFIICHSHPSGNLVASSSDKEITQAIVKSGKLLNLELTDHLIISRSDFLSIRKNHSYLWDSEF